MYRIKLYLGMLLLCVLLPNSIFGGFFLKSYEAIGLTNMIYQPEIGRFIGISYDKLYTMDIDGSLGPVKIGFQTEGGSEITQIKRMMDGSIWGLARSYDVEHSTFNYIFKLNPQLETVFIKKITFDKEMMQYPRFVEMHNSIKIVGLTINNYSGVFAILNFNKNGGFINKKIIDSSDATRRFSMGIDINVFALDSRRYVVANTSHINVHQRLVLIMLSDNDKVLNSTTIDKEEDPPYYGEYIYDFAAKNSAQFRIQGVSSFGISRTEDQNTRDAYLWVFQLNDNLKLEWFKVMEPGWVSQKTGFGFANVDIINNDKGFLMGTKFYNDNAYNSPSTTLLIQIDKNGNFVWAKKDFFSRVSANDSLENLYQLPDGRVSIQAYECQGMVNNFGIVSDQCTDYTSINMKVSNMQPRQEMLPASTFPVKTWEEKVSIKETNYALTSEPANPFGNSIVLCENPLMAAEILEDRWLFGGSYTLRFSIDESKMNSVLAYKIFRKNPGEDDFTQVAKITPSWNQNTYEYNFTETGEFKVIATDIFDFAIEVIKLSTEDLLKY